MGLNFALYELLLLASMKLRPAPACDRAPTWRQWLVSVKDMLLTSGVCGTLAGGLSKLAVYPMDTVKKQMQLAVVRCSFEEPTAAAAGAPVQDLGAAEGNCNSNSSRFASIRKCAAWLYRREGPRGFYKVSE